jgi:hypothetical protein
MSRLALSALTAIMLAAAYSIPAFALRPAHRVEATAIDHAVRSHARVCGGAGGGLSFDGDRISTANPRYAEAFVRDDPATCFALAFFLKRDTPADQRWRVIGELPDSAVECTAFHELPEPAVRDFMLQGVRMTGGFRRC